MGKAAGESLCENLECYSLCFEQWCLLHHVTLMFISVTFRIRWYSGWWCEQRACFCGLHPDFGQNAVRSPILCFPALRGCFLLCFTADVATGSWRRDFWLTFLVPEITQNACDGTHTHSWSILAVLYMCFSSCVSRDTGACVCVQCFIYGYLSDVYTCSTSTRLFKCCTWSTFEKGPKYQEVIKYECWRNIIGDMYIERVRFSDNI